MNDITTPEEKTSLTTPDGFEYDIRFKTQWGHDKPSDTHLAERLMRVFIRPGFKDEHHHGDGSGFVDQRLVSAAGTLWRCPLSGPDQLWREVTDHIAADIMRQWDRQEYGDPDKPKRLSISARQYKDVYQLIRERLLPLQDGFFDEAPYGISVSGGFVEVDPREKTIRLVELSHEHRQRQRLDVEVDLDADVGVEATEGTLLHRFLTTTHVGEDGHASRLAMGQFGFAAITGLATHYHRALFPYGPPGTGKSQFLELLSSFIPEEAQAKLTPQKVNDDRFVGALDGKLLNGVTEIGTSVMDPAIFKAAVLGEAVTANNKYEKPFSFRPRAAHIFCSNVLPRMKGADSAVWDRILPLSFDVRFRGGPDAVPNIGRIIGKQEAREVLQWMISCGRRLLEDGEYTMPASALEIFSEWREHSDSVTAWIATCCEINPHGEPKSRWLTQKDAYFEYKTWALSGGYKPVNDTEFKSRLKNAGVKTGKSSTRRANLEVLVSSASSTPWHGM